MRAKDVTLACEYRVKIGGRLAPVVVIARRERRSCGGRLAHHLHRCVRRAPRSCSARRKRYRLRERRYGSRLVGNEMDG